MMPQPNADWTRQSVRMRAQERSRLHNYLWWVFIGVLGLIAGLHFGIEAINLSVVQALFVIAVMLMWIAHCWLAFRMPVRCDACDFSFGGAVQDAATETWKYCPHCAAATDVVSKRVNSSPNTVAALYAMDRGDTTRQRAVRWRSGLFFSMLAFFILMVVVMPAGSFVFPSRFVIDHWYFIVAAAFFPHFLLFAVARLRGLRCVACEMKFDTQRHAPMVASMRDAPSKWNVCPGCAYSLDQTP